MATVTKLRRSGVDDVIEVMQADDPVEVMAVVKTRDGSYCTYSNHECSLETLSLGAQLLQAQVMRECGRLLAPEDIEHD